MEKVTKPCAEWAVAARGLQADGSGDGYLVRELPTGLLAGVIDVLGHGEEASVIAQATLEVLAAHAGKPLPDLMATCHERLKGTRGAALTLAELDANAGEMTWLGVGNVQGVLARTDPGALPECELLLRNGIVGLRLPRLRISTVPVQRGDMFVLATDGLHRRFRNGLDPKGGPRLVADRMLARFAKGTDDALVLATRYLGNPS